MTQTESKKPEWQAVPKNDRLKRWMVLDMSSPGTGKELVADNIRNEQKARRLAAALDLLEALGAARAVITSIVGTSEEYRIIAEQVAQIDAALSKAGAV